jgi:hypothetical protein
MPATVLTLPVKYFEPGLTKVNWLTAIASATYVPTRAEINAGSDFSAHVKESSGWDLKSNLIETPNLANRYNGKIGGRSESSDSGFMCYQSKNGTDVRTILTLDATGFIVWMDGGDVAGQKMDIFPVQVISNSPTRPMEVAMVSVQFGILDKPATYVTIPA